jgi:hypothetical protein
MRSIQAVVVICILAVNISPVRAEMKNKNWVCKNGPRTIGFNFDHKDESLTYRICTDKKCSPAESNGTAKLGSSVGSHYLYDIADSKTEERLTVYFSANAKNGVIPKDGRILSAEKGTNNNSEPAETFQNCMPAKI